jgi:hypothetical protein
VYQIQDERGILVKVGGFMCVWLKRVSHNGIEQWADEWARDMGIREGDNLIER